jgi:SAM-dependent methyltransferase
MGVQSAQLIDFLRASGEPTRLRILALLRRQDLSVGELTQILDQSQPRLSHHLKALAEAGLVTRLPEGAFMFYRAERQGGAGDFLDAIFQQLDGDDHILEADRRSLSSVMAVRAEAAANYFSTIAETWDRIRALHYPEEAIEAALLEMAGAGPFRRVLDFGTGTGRMLQLFADRAVELEGIDFSHQMLTVARANLERSGIRNAQVRHGNVTQTALPDGVADLVIVHQVLHFLDEPSAALREAARVLAPGGRLLIVDFAPHDLEFLRSEFGHVRLGVRHDSLVQAAAGSGLSIEAPRSFGPPEARGDGLSVHIWRAEKRSLAKGVAA